VDRKHGEVRLSPQIQYSVRVLRRHGADRRFVMAQLALATILGRSDPASLPPGRDPARSLHVFASIWSWSNSVEA
jgi:hypothetical protein